MRLPARITIASCCLSLFAGCDALDNSGSLLYVFSTHHATPEDGIFPDRGDEDQPRVFENDMGWRVTMLESFITIDSITIIGCDGHGYPLNMFWGPCPEDLRDEDLETLSVAGRKLPEGDYCELQVTYGPYEMPVVDGEADTRHTIPQNEAVDGATVYIRGGANRGEQEPVPFELRGEERTVLTLDLSETENGRPVHISDGQDFPEELTISKAYDRFFDGIDFEDFEPREVEDRLDDVLEEQTRVQEGTQVLTEE